MESKNIPPSPPSASAHEPPGAAGENGRVEPIATRPSRWMNRTVIGICAATFFSDFSHEMVTAVLPMYLASVGLGAAALGLIEGIADFLVSLSKLAGGVVGHRSEHKRPLAALGYLVTALATTSIGLAHQAWSLITLRSIAWSARGFRGPLRDFLLSDAVPKTHFGRVYGLERTADMLGAVVGPLTATLLVLVGLEFRSVILWAFIPGLLAAASMYFLTRERHDAKAKPSMATAQSGDVPAGPDPIPVRQARFPRMYWLFLGGATLFGIGDFSRTFLILLAAASLGDGGASSGLSLAPGHVSIAIVLYMLHNLISALAAYPIGRLGDRFPKQRVLVAGYAIGVVTNLLLALFSGSITWVVVAIVLSAVYYSVEETIEKAAAADFVPRELRSLGFGALAMANAGGDMISSIMVGALLQAGHSALAFGIAATFSGLGVLWMLVFVARRAR